jgi:hypothetical protein
MGFLHFTIGMGSGRLSENVRQEYDLLMGFNFQY